MCPISGGRVRLELSAGNAAEAADELAGNVALIEDTAPSDTSARGLAHWLYCCPEGAIVVVLGAGEASISVRTASADPEESFVDAETSKIDVDELASATARVFLPM